MKHGVFLGYVIRPGHKWNGEYMVAALEGFVGKDLRQYALASACNVNTFDTVTKVEWPGGPVQFPLQERYNQHNQTLAGLEGGLVDPNNESIEPRPENREADADDDDDDFDRARGKADASTSALDMTPGEGDNLRDDDQQLFGDDDDDVSSLPDSSEDSDSDSDGPGGDGLRLAPRTGDEEDTEFEGAHEFDAGPVDEDGDKAGDDKLSPLAPMQGPTTDATPDAGAATPGTPVGEEDEELAIKNRIVLLQKEIRELQRSVTASDIAGYNERSRLVSVEGKEIRSTQLRPPQYQPHQWRRLPDNAKEIELIAFVKLLKDLKAKGGHDARSTEASGSGGLH